MILQLAVATLAAGGRDLFLHEYQCFTSLWRSFWPLFKMLLRFIKAWGIHLCTALLKPHHSFSVRSGLWLGRFAAVLEVIVLLHFTIWSKLYLSDQFSHIWLSDTLVCTGVRGWFSDCKVPKSCPVLLPINCIKVNEMQPHTIKVMTVLWTFLWYHHWW